ncbi:HPP family protein [Hyalangium minutum]|uniref:CBS domain-containing protein n=1 Tax=Hyalangium minutum TaxID=394096 RepID=UPI0005C55F97|nr:CBS domain-containing protein [Hyalangium minutum]
MQQHGTSEEAAVPGTVTVLPTDTLLCALRVMERHQVRLLPVVEEKGTLLGLISEARILEAWEVDPLLRVSEVMEECGPPVDWGRQAYGH